MPNYCVASGCSACSDIHDFLTFHSFPDATKDKERRQKWEDALQRKNYTPGKTAKLCCLHFKETDYDPPVKITARKRLKKDAVPSMFPYHLYEPPIEVPESSLDPVPNGIRAEDFCSISLIEEPPFKDVEVQTIEKPSSKNVEVQTTLSGIELTETLAYLRNERRKLKQKVGRLTRRLNQAQDLQKKRFQED